jgi:hypothetical protein
MKRWIVLILLILCVNFVSADESFVFKQSQNFSLDISMSNADLSECLGCTCEYDLYYPNGTTLIRGASGNNVDGNCVYSTSSNTLGVHGGEIYFTNGVDYGKASFEFEITNNGLRGITTGEAMSIIGSFIIILALSFALFWFGLRMESVGLKLVVMGLGVIFFVVLILYSLVVVEQTAGLFTTIVNGYGEFWFVAKIFLSMAILSLVLFSLYIAWRYWKIKRGYDGEW